MEFLIWFPNSSLGTLFLEALLRTCEWRSEGILTLLLSEERSEAELRKTEFPSWSLGTRNHVNRSAQRTLLFVTSD